MEKNRTDCAKQYRSTQTRAIPLSGYAVRVNGPSGTRPAKDTAGCGILRGLNKEAPREMGQTLGKHFLEKIEPNWNAQVLNCSAHALMY